jgi:hypothetical protein
MVRLPSADLIVVTTVAFLRSTPGRRMAAIVRYTTRP